MSFIEAWIREFSLSSFLLGLIPFAIQWFNSLVDFKKENIRELKITAKDLIDTWANMKESAQKIMTFSAWIKEHEDSDNEFFREKIPSWYEGIYVEKQNLQAQYNCSIRLIGYLYFYYDGYRIQNKLEGLFLKMKDTEWDSQTFIKSWNDLWKFQNQGSEILREIKKEIDALSTLWPRPIHWIQINWNLLDLGTYTQRRWLRIMARRRIRLARISFRKHSNSLMNRTAT